MLVPLGLLIGAIGLEMTDVSGTTPALEAEILARVVSALEARTGDEVVVGTCAPSRCSTTLRLSVDAGVSRMSWVGDRSDSGRPRGHHELTGALGAADVLASSLAAALFPEARAAEPIALAAASPSGIAPAPVWPKLALATAGISALALGIGFGISSASGFADLNRRRDYTDDVPGAQDRAYTDRNVSVVLLSTATAAALGLTALLLAE
ncbi:MAG: hypothetical protein U1E65_14490 [Myxococcota bacterium]